jgi:hypothetical protein
VSNGVRTKKATDTGRHRQTSGEIEIRKKPTANQSIKRPALRRKGRTDEATQHPSGLARPRLRTASQIAIWMSIDLGRAALAHIGPRSQTINRCELPQLARQWVRCASFQRPRQVEPPRLTYAARCGTQSVVTVETCRETKTIPSMANDSIESRKKTEKLGMRRASLRRDLWHSRRLRIGSEYAGT